MATQNQLLNLPPFETEDIGKTSKVVVDTNPFNPPDDIYQLQTDVINVVEGRVDITTFEPAYQQRIKSYYKFTGRWSLSKYPIVAKRTSDTLDLV